MTILNTIVEGAAELRRMNKDIDGAWVKISPKMRLALLLEIGASLKVMENTVESEYVAGFELLVDRDPTASNYIQFGLAGDNKAIMVAPIESTEFLWRV